MCNQLISPNRLKDMLSVRPEDIHEFLERGMPSLILPNGQRLFVHDDVLGWLQRFQTTERIEAMLDLPDTGTMPESLAIRPYPLLRHMRLGESRVVDSAAIMVVPDRRCWLDGNAPVLPAEAHRRWIDVGVELRADGFHLFVEPGMRFGIRCSQIRAVQGRWLPIVSIHLLGQEHE